MIKNRCLENKEESAGCGACEQGGIFDNEMTNRNAYESLNVMC